MGKAKTDHTPEQPPLDDDAHWLPIEAAHKRGVERTGDNDLAVIDLEKLLAEDLPCMRRSTTTGERVRVAAIAWTELISLETTSDGARVIYRKPLAQFKRHHIVNPVRGWRFSVWQPVLDRIWPPAGSASIDHEEPLLKINRAKAALLHLYPSKTTMPGSLKAAHKAVVTECEERGWQPPSEDTVQRAAEKLGYRPPRKRQ